MTRRLTLYLLPVTAFAIWFVWGAYTNYAPARYDITAPIDLTDMPTFVTELKLRFASPDTCYAALANAGVMFELLPDEEKGRDCAFRDVARLDRSYISWGGGVTLRCQMLSGIAMWERHHLQPAAEELFGSKIVKIQHYGSYACRNINNAQGGSRSQHAFANAVDVAGFVLENGETISVKRDWGAGGVKAQFLARAHKSACKRFNTVLGPNYNDLHNDHFHFDNGAYMSCK